MLYFNIFLTILIIQSINFQTISLNDLDLNKSRSFIIFKALCTYQLIYFLRQMGACSQRNKRLAVKEPQEAAKETQEAGKTSVFTNQKTTQFIPSSSSLPELYPQFQQHSQSSLPIRVQDQSHPPPIFPIKDFNSKSDEDNLSFAREIQQSTIGLLSWFDKSAVKHFGSGVLIRKNIVLTSASNIYNKQYQQQNWGFDFQLGGNSQEGKVYQVEKWIYNKDYIKSCDDEKTSLQYNYAIIKLRKSNKYPINSKNILALQVPEHICLKCTKEVQVQLYRLIPKIQRNIPYYHQKIQYVPIEKGSITEISPKEFKIRYRINVAEQDKGCPLFLDQKIIAIHTERSVYACEGEGRLITKDMVDDIQQLCKKFEDSQTEDSSEQEDFDKKIDQQKVKEQLRDRLKDFLKKQQEDVNNGIPRFFNKDSDTTTKLQTIDLSSKDSNKLTAESIKVFAQFKLDNLEELKLDNNRIADQGLESLCKNDYPSLKAIQIDDNNVSINGIRHLIFNNWSDEVEYKLYSVSSNDDGYFLKVGEEIPLIKTLIKEKDLSQNKTTMNCQEKTVLNATKLLLNTPIDDQDPKQIELQSQELEDQYKNAKDKSSLPSVLLLLKKSIGENIQFRKKSGLKTNISSKIIFGGSNNQRVSFEIDLKNFKELHTQKLKKSSKKLKQLEKQFFDKIQQQYGVDTSDLTLDKVLNNPARAEASDSTSQALGKNLAAYQTMKVKFKQHFEKFQLSEQEFDPTGDFQFPQPSQASIQERGGFPYYQPVIGKRFGIKVSNVFKDKDWLLMNNNKGEYAIGFHGINNPLKSTALQSIMKGRETGEMLRAGLGQAYSDGDCINKNEKVGKGIYFSPYFLTSLLEYSSISLEQQHHIVLQCRLKPDSIKITNRPDYWVVNKSEDIRPYGILLFTREQINELHKIHSSRSSVILHRQIYKDQFNKQTWQSKYSSRFNSFKNK